MADETFPTSCLGHQREDGAALLEETENSGEAPAAITDVGPVAAAALSSCRSLKRKRPTTIKIPPILKEIPLEEVEAWNGAAGDGGDGLLGSARGPGWGVFSKKGRRKKAMEDAYRVASGPQDKIFCGVYDGHGGRTAVEYVMENLHTNVFEMLGKCDGIGREEAIRAGFLRTDQEFLKRGLSGGTCCVIALIEKEVVVSNLGDCRAVLSRGGIAEALTNDHTASRVDEQDRIQQKGGNIEDHKGTWRVQGTLAVTRSIGDIHLKEWVLAEPDTVVLPLTSDMEFLILASDGLWGKVGNQEAVDVAIQICNEGNSRTKTEIEAYENQFGCENTSPPAKIRKIEQSKQQMTPQCSDLVVDSTLSPGFCGPSVACKRLARIATTRGSLDDVTVMIIDLSHFFKS